jgi:hypothetical protein
MDVNNIFKGNLVFYYAKKKIEMTDLTPPVLRASLACNMKVKIIITL